MSRKEGAETEREEEEEERKKKKERMEGEREGQGKGPWRKCLSGSSHQGLSRTLHRRRRQKQANAAHGNRIAVQHRASLGKLSAF